MRVARVAMTAVAWYILRLGPAGLEAQSPPAQAQEALRVFLDCHGPCDFDYFRREITYVNWVRDRQDADVHLLLTTQQTGGGGRQYTLKTIGLRAFAGSDDEYVFNSQQSDTFDEIRELIAQRIGLALARYAARGSLAGNLRLTFKAPEGGPTSGGQQPRDPWNLWVFSIQGNAFIESESRLRSVHISGSARARRVTEKWKLGMEIEGNRSTSRFELDSGEVVHSKRSNYSWSLLGVRSIGPHWSAGLNAGARRSSRDNYDVQARIAPGIEYDVFPYSESTRRQFVFVYEVALIYNNYHEETIFSKLQETRPSHAFTVAAEAIQPWGQTEARLTWSNYLDDWSQNRAILDVGLEFRITRGLRFTLQGSYSRVHDQLSLAKEGATDDEVLLQLKQLNTNYSFFGAIGLQYTFGSKFNNVVNPRFDATFFDF